MFGIGTAERSRKGFGKKLDWGSFILGLFGPPNPSPHYPPISPVNLASKPLPSAQPLQHSAHAALPLCAIPAFPAAALAPPSQETAVQNAAAAHHEQDLAAGPPATATGPTTTEAGAARAAQGAGRGPVAGAAAGAGAVGTRVEAQRVRQSGLQV